MRGFWNGQLSLLGLATNTTVTVTGSVVYKLLDLAALTVAGRQLSLEQVGVFFFAEALAAIAFTGADLGLWPVLIRRSARGEMNRRTLWAGHGVRFLGVVLCLALGTAVSGPLMADAGLGAMLFVSAAGLMRLHEVGRTVLIGQERFALNVSIGVTARGVGTGVSIAALLLGFGVVGWALGRLLGEVLQFAVISVVAFRSVPEKVRPETTALLRESLPFWGRNALEAVATNVDVLVLTAVGGLQAASILGLAGRIAGAALIVAGNLATVAYPALARNRPAIAGIQVWVVSGLSAVVCAATVVLGPLIALLIVPTWQRTDDLTVQILAASVLFGGIYQPLRVWLDAQDREVAVTLVTAVALVTSLPFLWLGVQWWAAPGAAVAVAWRGALLVIGASFVARRMHRPHGTH